VATHVLDLQLELRLRALLGTFEGEMLEEMGGTVGAVGLGARTSVNPYTDSAGLRVWGVLGCDLSRHVRISF